MEIPLTTTTGAWLEKAGGGRIALAGNCALGRSHSSTVLIDDLKASRHHATLHAQDSGEWWLIDLGSSNGTQLNGRRAVQPVRLRDGDRIAIAESVFTFRQSGPAAEASASDTSALATLAEVRTERRWLLLADIEGYTPMSQRLAAEELATLVGQWVRAGRDLVEAQGGTVNKYLGDGWLASWPAQAGSAAQVAAAVAALGALREQAAPLFRVVVHCGEIAVGGAAILGEECLMGPEVNFIFRVEKVAGGAGAAFCFTAAAHAELAPLLALKPIPGRHALKGFPGDYEFYRL